MEVIDDINKTFNLPRYLLDQNLVDMMRIEHYALQYIPHFGHFFSSFYFSDVEWPKAHIRPFRYQSAVERDYRIYRIPRLALKRSNYYQ